MTYPLSSPVLAGQPTAAAHYNYLRTDALYLGQASEDAAVLGQLLAHYSDNLNLSRLGSNRLRIEAAPETPVALVIQGCPCRVTANVDLASGAAPSGSAAAWFVFVQRASGASTFTLSVNTSATPAPNQALIGAFYWDGSQIVADSVSLLQRERLLKVLNLSPSQQAGGRLCLQSGEPYGSDDRSGSTVYYSPFTAGVIALYAPGFGWVNHAFSEISLPLPGTPDTNYDIFAGWDGSAVQLSALAWASDSLRAASLSLQDGRWVLGSDASLRYLGSVRVGAGGVAVDSKTQRLVWNADNRRAKLIYRMDSTTHTYGSATWRMWNDDSDNYAQLLLGENNPLTLQLFGDQSGSVAGDAIRVGIGVNSIGGSVILGSSSGDNFKGSVVYCNVLAAGVHQFNVCEYGNASSTCTYFRATLSGEFWC